MKEPRNKTFVWISWLAKLLAGEVQCVFSCWFKAHYKYDKLASGFNLVMWTMDHNALIHKTRDELETQGYTVTIEDQNSFKLEMHEATISYKPDIIAIKQKERLIVDCKTGRPKNSDTVQVMLYMMLTPKAEGDLPWNGRIVYKNSVNPVPDVAITERFANIVGDAIKQLSNVTARKVPSENECKRCDINEEDCPERIEEDERRY